MPIPSLAPVGPTDAICLGCGNHMRLVVEKFKNGKVMRLMMYCDTCKYGHEPSMDHVRGQAAKYVSKEEQAQQAQAKEQKPQSLPGGKVGDAI